MGRRNYRLVAAWSECRIERGRDKFVPASLYFLMNFHIDKLMKGKGGGRAMEKKEKSRLELLERKSLYLNGVHNVDLFDEEKIILQTDLGRLVIKGKSMNITNLDVEHGNIQIDGRINCLEYLPERRLWPMKKK